QRRLAELSAQLEAARALLHAASSAFDQGRATSPLPYIQAKVICAETAVRVTQDLMTMFGGTAFAGRLPFERYFRDARAGLVMGLANDQAYERITAIMFPEVPRGERVPPVQNERALDCLVVMVAVCTMSNRIVQGLGLTTPSPVELHEAVERLHRQGYAGTEQYIRAQAEHANAPCDRRA